MTTERVEVRLDQERRRKLQELATERGVPISAVVRSLIDEAYEEKLRARRRLAVERIVRMEIEDVPDPETLSRQLSEAHEPGGLS